MTKDEKNKLACKILGICWHKKDTKRGTDYTYYCVCGKKFYLRENLYKHCKFNPDFTSDAGKVQLLEQIEKRKDVHSLLVYLWDNIGTFPLSQDIGGSYRNAQKVSLPINYLTDKTGLLLDKFLDWWAVREGLRG